MAIGISVIVPVFNAEKYLEQCIKSILSQSFLDFELILVDDGSTDSSSVICEKYSKKDQRVKYFKKTNSGSFHTRLFGIQKAQGDYITFCDADDYYSSNEAFDKMYNSALSSGASLVQFGYIKKYNHLSRKMRKVSHPTFIDKNEFVSKHYPVFLCSFWDESMLNMNMWSKLYKRSMIEDLSSIVSEERIFYGDDLIFNLISLKNCDSLFVISDCLYVYRNNVGGTKRFNLNTMDDLNIIKKYQLSYIDKSQSNEKDNLYKVCYSEIAGWFVVWLKDAYKHLNKQELLEKIDSILAYPAFMSATQFYRGNNEDWDAANLLRLADAEQYYQYLNTSKKRTKLNITEIFKYLYKHV